MGKIVQKLYGIAGKIVKTVCFTLCVLFFAAAFFIHARYDYGDFPFFERNHLEDYMMLLVCCLALAVLYRKRDLAETLINKKVCTVIFMVTAISFIILLPLKPYSDMGEIYHIGLEIADKGLKAAYESEYLQTYPNNLIISYIFGIRLWIFPDSILTLKIFNIILIIITAYVSIKILRIFSKIKYENIFYMLLLGNMSVLMYANHIYTDILFSTLTLFSTYLFLKKEDGFILSSPLLGVSYFIRPVAVIYMIVFGMIELFKEENWKKAEENRYWYGDIRSFDLGLSDACGLLF